MNKLTNNLLKETLLNILGKYVKHSQKYLIRNNRLFQNLEYNELSNLFRKIDIELIVDIGANRGQFKNKMRKELGFQGTILSIEANPNLYEYLKNAAQIDNNWHIANIALGEAEDKLSFNIFEDDKLSSLLPGASSSERFKDKFEKPEVIEVKVQRFDKFMEEYNYVPTQKNWFVKLDTQGYDLKVFEGFGKYSANVVVLQAELSVKPLYQNMPHISDSIQFYEQKGFSLLSLVPVTRERDFGEVIEYDSLWINKNLI